MTKLEKKIINIIAEQLGISEEEITPKSSLRTDFGAESLVIGDLLTKIQEEIGVELDEIDPEKVKTVGGLINIVVNQNTEYE